MTSPEQITVVICTYNNAAMLDRTLQAIGKQRVAPDLAWSVLVVDNNCSDETPQVVARRADSLPVPLELVREPTQGINAARLCGVRHSRGSWIAFVDDDCLLEPDWVQQAVDFGAAHPLCGAFGGEIVLRWESPPPEFAAGYGYAFAETRLGETAFRRDWLVGAGMVLRRSILEATGWTDRQFLEDRIGRRLVSGGDVEMGVRIAALSELWYVPQCRLHHVIPARRLERGYLRRLVFGLGVGSHDVAMLTWPGSEPAWWAHSLRRFWKHFKEGARRAGSDLRRHRAAFAPLLAVAFAAGWAAGMCRSAVAGRRYRRERLGGLAGSSVA
jgi:glycosyltransferase involved in cell wall biosynthesis